MVNSVAMDSMWVPIVSGATAGLIASVSYYLLYKPVKDESGLQRQTRLANWVTTAAYLVFLFIGIGSLILCIASVIGYLGNMDATRYLAPMIVFGLLSIVMIVLALIVRFSGARNTYRETWQYVEVASQRGIIRMSYAEIVDYRIGYSTLHLCDSRGQSATIYYRLYSMPHLISYLYKMNPADERIDLLAARSRHPNAQPLIEDSESELRS